MYVCLFSKIFIFALWDDAKVKHVNVLTTFLMSAIGHWWKQTYLFFKINSGLKIMLYFSIISPALKSTQIKEIIQF